MMLARAWCLTVIMLALGSGAFATPVPPETERLIRAASPAQLDIVAAIPARASFDVNYESEPPPGAESTDTITRFALVYAFSS